MESFLTKYITLSSELHPVTFWRMNCVGTTLIPTQKSVTSSERPKNAGFGAKLPFIKNKEDDKSISSYRQNRKRPANTKFTFSNYRRVFLLITRSYKTRFPFMHLNGFLSSPFSLTYSRKVLNSKIQKAES